MVAVVAIATSYMCWKGYHAAAMNPDVKWDKTHRGNHFFERDMKEAQKWVDGMHNSSRWNRPGLDVGGVSIFESWGKPSKKEGSAVTYGPAPPTTA